MLREPFEICDENDHRRVRLRSIEPLNARGSVRRLASLGERRVNERA
jgi:hypothetical protein